MDLARAGRDGFRHRRSGVRAHDPGGKSPRLIQEAIERQARRAHVLLVNNASNAQITTVRLTWPRLHLDQTPLEVGVKVTRRAPDPAG